jgi:hypothetical protein
MEENRRTADAEARKQPEKYVLEKQLDSLYGKQ